MTKELFKKIIEEIKLTQKYNHKYYKFGIDLYEGKYPIAEVYGRLTELFWGSLYSEYGVDWINWFMYENDFGKNKMKAWDGDKLICQTVDELYDFIEQYKL